MNEQEMPDAIVDGDEQDDGSLDATCPRCGKRDHIDGFDVIGACDDNVFCTNCHCEFDPSTGVIHLCNTDALDAATNRERGRRCPGLNAEE